MKQLIKKIPLPITGLMLALAAAGNLVQSYGNIYRNIFGLLSAIILVIVLCKIIIYPGQVKQELKNPVVASVFPTITMGSMLLSTYLKPYFPTAAYWMWNISVIVHLYLMIKFTLNYILKFNMKNVFPSWFIVYVGIVVGSVTAPVFSMEVVGKILFWIGLISYFGILPLALIKIRLKTIPEPALPTIAIFAAPVALCLAGYINSFEIKNITIIIGLAALSQLSYVLVLLKLPKLLKLKFYPSFSAFTFPLVITAISLKLTNGFLASIYRPLPLLKYIVSFEVIVAVLIVLYILFEYIKFLFLTKEENISTISIKSV